MEQFPPKIIYASLVSPIPSLNQAYHRNDLLPMGQGFLFIRY